MTVLYDKLGYQKRQEEGGARQSKQVEWKAHTYQKREEEGDAE